MIRLEGISHAYRDGFPLLKDASVVIPSDRRVALLGGIESGKTTVLNMIAGLIVPDAGRVERFSRVSFPAGYQRGFRTASTARQNVEFAAKIYGADPAEVSDFVGQVTGFGDLMDLPMKDLSVQERMTLSYALTYAIPFDTYLFDNSVAFGLPAFRDRCLAMYEARSASAGMIVATRHARIAEQFCECALLISNGKLTFFDQVGDALDTLANAASERDRDPRTEAPSNVMFDEQA